MIPFNKPPKTGLEHKFVDEALNSDKLCGGGSFTKKCESWIEENFAVTKALLTPSCTASLEMAAILIDIGPDDEVIMPSYTFVSTANAFALRGAKIIFIDIRPDTLNIDETKIEAAITNKTKAIVPVHYAGISCEMDVIMEIADRYGLYVVEDAAQGVMSSYKGKALGSIGHIGCFSFHETKNYTSGGEGGAILVNDQLLVDRAEIIREKGTNRKQFINGLVDKYSWVDVGSSFLMSDLQAAYLYSQLIEAKKINDKRLGIWARYNEELSKDSSINEPYVDTSVEHNAHMYFLRFRSKDIRDEFISKMRDRQIICPFHYGALHLDQPGRKFGIFVGDDSNTINAANCIARLPLFYNLSMQEVDQIIATANSVITGLKSVNS